MFVQYPAWKFVFIASPFHNFFFEFEFSWFLNTKQSSEILILNIEMLLEFQNKTNIEIIGL